MVAGVAFSLETGWDSGLTLQMERGGRRSTGAPAPESLVPPQERAQHGAGSTLQPLHWVFGLCVLFSFWPLWFFPG